MCLLVGVPCFLWGDAYVCAWCAGKIFVKRVSNVLAGRWSTMEHDEHTHLSRFDSVQGKDTWGLKSVVYSLP